MDQAGRERWHGKVVRYLGNTSVGPGLFPDEGPEFVQIPKGGYGYYRWEYVDPVEGSSEAGRWNLVGPLKTREGSRKRYADRGPHIWIDNGYTTEDHYYSKQCAGCRFGQRLGGCKNVATAEDGSDLELAINNACPHFTPGPPGSWDPYALDLSIKPGSTVTRAEAAEGEAAEWRAFAADVARAVHPGERGQILANRLSVEDLVDLRASLHAALGSPLRPAPAVPTSPPPTGDTLMSAMTPERASALIERSKNDRDLIVGSEVREVCRAYLDALSEIDRLREAAAALTRAAPIQPPLNSGWVLRPDGSYIRGLEVMYFDPNFVTASGRRGLWFKKHPHEQQGRSVGGGPAQGFWGDDTEP